MPLRTTRSTLSPMRLGDFVEVPGGLRDLRFLPVLAVSDEFVEPVPASPPRFTYRPQWPVRIRNMMDVMLQEGEFEWGQARELVRVAETIEQEDLRLGCVHFFDPLGEKRLLAENLLPQLSLDAGDNRSSQIPDDAILTGVDFFQAWTFSRLLGLAVGNDPTLFRLPFGCELELAAFGGVRGQACHGVGARGGT